MKNGKERLTTDGIRGGKLMFLHLGGMMMIRTEELIAVENIEKKSGLDDWIEQRQRADQQVVDISEGKPKSAIYTDQKIILSAIASTTLKKRLKQIPTKQVF
jgi:regulator of extracellular matrix RemA (YlzA/DUF370 family)